MASIFDNIGLGPLEAISVGGFDYWIILGINIILSTVVSGIVLMIIVGILSKKYGEKIEFGNAFLMALVVNIVTYFGIVGMLGAFLPSLISMLLPLIVWIVLAKFFFSEMSLVHILIVAILGYVLSIFFVPPLAAIIRGMLPI
jgi:hypothetical protein